MQRATSGLRCLPDFVLVDARRIPQCPAPQTRHNPRATLCLPPLLAASIIAKTTRDAHMLELDALYAGYGFASHKGYPTPEHCRALKELGALTIHRRSFGRVREVLGLDSGSD